MRAATRKIDIAKNLRRILARRKITQAKFALMMECSPEEVSMYATGARTPTAGNLVVIAETLNVSLEALVYGR